MRLFVFAIALLTMSNAEGAITRAASQLPQEGGGGDEQRKRGNDSFALSDDDRAWIEAAIGPTATLSPSCWIHYPRVTLVGVHHEERLTLDLGLTFDQHDEPVGFDGAVIAEVKQPRFAPRSPAMRALRGVGARRRRVSKYCSGIALLEPTRRTHVFRPTLRDLHRMDDARSLP